MKIKLAKGDIVTCRYPVEFDYSGYCGNPIKILQPGERVVVAYPDSPKVRIVGTPPENDKRDVRIVCDALGVQPGGTNRVSLNYCNVVKVQT